MLPLAVLRSILANQSPDQGDKEGADVAEGEKTGDSKAAQEALRKVSPGLASSRAGQPSVMLRPCVYKRRRCL